MAINKGKFLKMVSNTIGKNVHIARVYRNPDGRYRVKHFVKRGGYKAEAKFKREILYSRSALPKWIKAKI